MVDFKQWKEVWRKQPTQTVDIQSLIGRINEGEAKHKRDRKILSILFPLTILALFVMAWFFESWVYYVGVSMMTMAMLVILYLSYKNTQPVIKDEVQLQNASFLAAYIEKLKQNVLMTSKYMWGYAILLIAGINICYLEALQDLDSGLRLLIHLGVSAMMIFGFYYSIKKRMKVNREEVYPLIQKLEDLVINE